MRYLVIASEVGGIPEQVKGLQGLTLLSADVIWNGTTRL